MSTSKIKADQITFTDLTIPNNSYQQNIWTTSNSSIPHVDDLQTVISDMRDRISFLEKKIRELEVLINIEKWWSDIW